MASPSIANFSTGMELQSAPINPAWILDGTPTARNRVLSNSSDRFAWTMLWDCTAGKFNWRYDLDETVHVIEGSVTVTDGNGVSKTLRPGDIAFFAAGTTAHWHVENYVRKVAFCQRQVPATIHLPIRALRGVKSRLASQFRQLADLVRGSLVDRGIEPQSAPDASDLAAPLANFKVADDARFAGQRSRGV
jgi:uncharacterized protein